MWVAHPSLKEWQRQSCDTVAVNAPIAKPGIDSAYPPPPANPLPLLPSPLLQAPVKNEVNEPKNIGVACQWVADLKNVPVEVVVEATTANARVLFHRAFSR